jgi:hypothetical protein
MENFHMHFRQRNNVIQIIRTVYDPETKKGKNEIVGRLNRTRPEISDDLRNTLTTEEVHEVEGWLDGRLRLEHLQAEIAARTLPDSMLLATQWLTNPENEEEARRVYIEIQQALHNLRRAVNQANLIEK